MLFGADDFKTFGRPRLGFLVTAGNIDSMVAHYTASKKKRTYERGLRKIHRLFILAVLQYMIEKVGSLAALEDMK